MNKWIIVAITAGLLILGGLAVASTVTADNDVEVQENSIECSSCGNSCSLNNNCGLESCAVVSGGRSCGCR